MSVTHHHLHAGDPVPDPIQYDALVILGGQMGVYDTHDFPFLDDELEMIGRAVEHDVPVLGICLGSQLIAHALGGEAYLAPEPEVGLVDLELTGHGRRDPVVGSLHPTVLAVHQDTFRVPSEATVLAASDRFPHVFRIGTALGIQFHPEASVDIVRVWAGSPGLVRRSGIDVEGFLARIEQMEDLFDREASALFDRWLAEASPSG